MNGAQRDYEEISHLTVVALARFDAAKTEEEVQRRLKRITACALLHATAGRHCVVRDCGGTATKLCG